MKLFRNIIALIIGIPIGMVLNGLLISISGDIIPPPEGAEVTTMEGLKESLHLFEPKHFIMPFLAHALGTLLGAFVAAAIAATHKMTFAWVAGFLFLAAGIANVVMLPAPMWFNITDLVLAYLPMAYLGGKLAVSIGAKQRRSAAGVLDSE